MGKHQKNGLPDATESTQVVFPRRRLGRVEHDERGNARMEWALLPASQAPERQVLQLLDEPGAGGESTLSLARDPKRGFDPYGGALGRAFDPPPAEPRRKPKDLRKLGEWLKMTRELEERRKRGED